MPRKKKAPVVKEPKNIKKEIMQNLFDTSVIELAENGYIKQNTYALIEPNMVVPLNVKPLLGFSLEEILEKELERIHASAMITVGVGSLSIISPEMKEKDKEKYKDITKIDQADIPPPVTSVIVVLKEKYGTMTMLHSKIYYDIKGTPYTKEENWLDNVPTQAAISEREPIGQENRTNC